MSWDGVVIGGGAAGMYAALWAARNQQKVLLLERNDRLGKKLLITGKGRCNVTNNCGVDELMRNIPRNSRFLYSAFSSHGSEAVISFFENNGCGLKTERGNRVFPVTDQAQSVLNTLKNALDKAGVTICKGRACRIDTDQGGVVAVATENDYLPCKWVILATGGLSYPGTGSTGDGYKLASKLGHTVTDCDGSLVPLGVDGGGCRCMQRLSLRNVAVKLINEKGKVLFKDFGELLFTHFGISGPTVLSASAHMKGNCAISIDLKPALDEAKLEQRILRDLETYKNRTMENALTDLLPRSMIPVVLRRLQIDPSQQANSFSKENRRRLVQLIKNFTLKIVGKRPVSEAIITSGGVKVSEIDPKTMESKLVSGLYFAGEIIDCDAYTGGFNLQIAWSTAYCAAMASSNENRH